MFVIIALRLGRTHALELALKSGGIGRLNEFQIG